jgi:hypothetical protein
MNENRQKNNLFPISTHEKVTVQAIRSTHKPFTVAFSFSFFISISSFGLFTHAESLPLKTKEAFESDLACIIRNFHAESFSTDIHFRRGYPAPKTFEDG